MSETPASPPAGDDPLICFCHGVFDSEIRRAIKEGADSLTLVKERTRASTGCGGCTCECERILVEMLGPNAKISE